MVRSKRVADRINRFIEAMFRKQADHLLFRTGHPVQVRKGQSQQTLLDKTVETQQVIKLLEPISGGRDFRKSGEHSFYYLAPAGRVHVRAVRSGERISAILSPQLDAMFEARPFTEDAEVPPELAAVAAMPASSTAAATRGPAPELPADAVEGEIPELPPPPPGLPLPPPNLLSPPFEGSEDIDIEVAFEARAAFGPCAIDPVLEFLTELGGTQLYLTPGQVPLMRKGTELEPLPGWQTLGATQLERWLLEAAHLDVRQQIESRFEADFTHAVEGHGRFRIRVHRDRHGLGGVIRVLPSEIPTAEGLGLPDAVLELSEFERGMVLVTGPVGSGKSTTLAVLIDRINHRRRGQIITLEDPIEVVHDNAGCLVSQRELHTHVTSIFGGLRAALREDPAVVVLSELTDPDTLQLALEAAESGPLVLGALPTPSVVGAIDRIVDAFPPERRAYSRVLVSEAVRAVVSQTLCRRIDGGRIAVHEVLRVTPEVRHLIREGRTAEIPSMIGGAEDAPLRSQVEALVELVQSKVVSAEDALASAADRTALEWALARG